MKEEPARQEGGEQCPGEIVKKILGSWSQGERESSSRKKRGAMRLERGPGQQGRVSWAPGAGVRVRAVGTREGCYLLQFFKLYNLEKFLQKHHLMVSLSLMCCHFYLTIPFWRNIWWVSLIIYTMVC